MWVDSNPAHDDSVKQPSKSSKSTNNNKSKPKNRRKGKSSKHLQCPIDTQPAEEPKEVSIIPSLTEISLPNGLLEHTDQDS